MQKLFAFWVKATWNSPRYWGLKISPTRLTHRREGVELTARILSVYNIKTHGKVVVTDLPMVFRYHLLGKETFLVKAKLLLKSS